MLFNTRIVHLLSWRSWLAHQSHTTYTHEALVSERAANSRIVLPANVRTAARLTNWREPRPDIQQAGNIRGCSVYNPLHFARAFRAQACLPFCVSVGIWKTHGQVTQVGARAQPLPFAFQPTGENFAKTEGGLQVDRHQNHRPAGKKLRSIS